MQGVRNPWTKANCRLLKSSWAGKNKFELPEHVRGQNEGQNVGQNAVFEVIRHMSVPLSGKTLF